MNSRVRRAGAFAAVGSIALAVPVLDVVGAAPFAAIALVAVVGIHDGPVFDLFARPGEHRDQRLYGLIGFTLSASAVALLAAGTGMPVEVGVGTILLVAYGNLATQVVRTRERTDGPLAVVAAFVGGGAVGYAAGAGVTLLLEGTAVPSRAPEIAFLAASGALLAGLLRVLLSERDDPHVMLSVGLWLWLLAVVFPSPTPTTVAIAIAISAALGGISYVLDTASVGGMLAGTLLALVTLLLGGSGWFVVLVAFFAIGGLSTKYRFEEKRDRGMAEDDEGSRGAENVLANGAAGLVAVLAYAAVAEVGSPLELSIPAVGNLVLPVAGSVFAVAFAGSVATALGDTLASEIGGVYDDVRMITTLEPVEPGTDGGVTWQGELAGIGGAVLVSLIAVEYVDAIAPVGGGIVAVAGVAGTNVDSLLGATLEGDRLGNSGVNFLSTAVGAVIAAALAVALGVS